MGQDSKPPVGAVGETTNLRVNYRDGLTHSPFTDNQLAQVINLKTNEEQRFPNFARISI